jgi:hypothetical protein
VLARSINMSYVIGHEQASGPFVVLVHSVYSVSTGNV